MTLVMPTLLETKITFKPIATGSVRDKNTNFDSDKTSSMSEKIKIRQYLRSSSFK